MILCRKEQLLTQYDAAFEAIDENRVDDPDPQPLAMQSSTVTQPHSDQSNKKNLILTKNLGKMYDWLYFNEEKVGAFC